MFLMLVKTLNHSSQTLFKPNFGRALVRHVSGRHSRDYLKERLSVIVPEFAAKVAQLKEVHRNTLVDTVSVSQVLGGMRDIKCFFHEPSLLHDEKGIMYRGLTVDEVREKLPKLTSDGEPLPEGLYWLLLTGEIPTLEQVKWLSSELASRAELPAYLLNIINMFPDNMHPMTQFSAAVTLCSRFSKFAAAYNTGNVARDELWKPMYEDCLDLVAKVPVIAAKIYRNCFKDGTMVALDPKLDWAANYARLLGVSPKPNFTEYLRLYMVAHADHEGGNVSAHTTHLVGSGLADVYLAFASGLNGLSGPLHGRANQEVMQFSRRLIETVGIKNLSVENVRKYCEEKLKVGVIPGFGHAVLRITDPRYVVQRRFVDQHIRDDPAVALVDVLYQVVPELLKQTGKVKNPWPNVDSISGTLLNHYGLTELEYYTVPFGVSRVMGTTAAIIWARAISLPLERPKSVDLTLLTKLAQDSSKD